MNNNLMGGLIVGGVIVATVVVATKLAHSEEKYSSLRRTFSAEPMWITVKNEANKKGKIKEHKFHVVTYPDKDSTLDDILFEADMARMKLQFYGGLKPEEIAGVFDEKESAKNLADKLITIRDEIKGV